MVAGTQKKLIGKEALLNIVAARVFAYSFLARAFLDEPTKEFIELLTEEGLIDSFPNLDENPMLKEGHDSVSFVLRDPDILTDEALGNLVGEYNKIFTGLGRKKSVNPYESVYTTTDRLVFQQQTMDVRAAYAKHDLRVEKFQQEPDDHVGLELKFMQVLSEKCLKELRDNRFHKARRLLRDQQDFLDNHLLKWAPRMAEEMAGKSESGFYRGVAQMLSGYIKADKEVVDSLIGEVGERLKRHKAKNEMKSV